MIIKKKPKKQANKQTKRLIELCKYVDSTLGWGCQSSYIKSGELENALSSEVPEGSDTVLIL